MKHIEYHQKDGVVDWVSVAEQHDLTEDEFFELDDNYANPVKGKKIVQITSTGWCFDTDNKTEAKSVFEKQEVEQYRNLLLTNLDSVYQQELASCTVSVKLSTGKTLTLSTAQSTLQTLGTALTMVQYGNGFDWVGDDGKTYKLSTVDDVISCITAISNHNTNASQVWAKLENQIKNCTTRDELNSIIIDFHNN